MKQLNFFKFIKPITYFNVINHYKILFEETIYYIEVWKRRRYLRNSKVSDFLIKKYIGNDLKIDKIREIFFQKRLFSYSDRKEYSQLIEILNNNCKHEINEYIKIADQVVLNEIKIFGSCYKFEKGLNWHYSFFKNYQWEIDQSNFLNISPKFNNANIDVKYVWALNRHHFLTYLGLAYYYTHDEKYAIKFKDIIYDWIRNNPPMIGINWYSGLEISIRLISWIFSLLFFKDSKLINNSKFFEIVFKSMFQHAYYLRYFYKKRSFNHTIGDLCGVYLFSEIFNDFKQIKKWKKKVLKKFKEQIFLQVRPDGFHIEQSVNYHKFVLEFFTIFLILNKTLIDHPEGILIKKMFANLFAIVKPNGTLPLVGDNDDGKVLLLTSHNNKSHLDLINLGCIIYKCSDFKFIQKEVSPLSVLLLGSESVKIFKSLNPTEPSKKFQYFKDSGYSILRNGWFNRSSYLYLDLGNFGPQNAGHSHSDISNIIFSYKGTDILINSGTYSYNKSWKERNSFRSSKAHNIISIDNQCQAKPICWFAWTQKPKTYRKVIEKDKLINFTCIHDGYKGFLVQRSVISSKNFEFIIIRDFIKPTSKNQHIKTHEIELNYHFSEGLPIKIHNAGQDCFLVNNELLLTISSNSKFKIKVENDVYCPNYGEKHENSVLNIHLTTNFSDIKKIEIITEFKPLAK